MEFMVKTQAEKDAATAKKPLPVLRQTKHPGSKRWYFHLVRTNLGGNTFRAVTRARRSAEKAWPKTYLTQKEINRRNMH